MKLLMHMCCAPCSTYPVKAFREEGMDITGFFYNPNIHPLEEYQLRRDTVKEYAKIVDLDIKYENDYMEDTWINYKGDPNSRCTMCYSLRLDKAAAYAKENNYDAFSTSLLVSPYQKHDLIKVLGEKYAKKYGIEFIYRDFRPFFREGQAIAKEMNLYRQKYCGCIISFNERKQKNMEVKK